MQGIGTGMNLFADFNNISSSKSGINDLAGICVGNPFRTILQTAATQSGQIIQTADQNASQAPLTQEELDTLQTLLSDLQSLINSEMPGARELKQMLENADAEGLLGKLGELIKPDDLTEEVKPSQDEADDSEGTELEADLNFLAMAPHLEKLLSVLNEFLAGFGGFGKSEGNSGEGTEESLVEAIGPKNESNALQGEDGKVGNSKHPATLIHEVEQIVSHLQAIVTEKLEGKQLEEGTTKHSPSLPGQIHDMPFSSVKSDTEISVGQEKLLALSSKIVSDIQKTVSEIEQGADPVRIAPKVLKLLEQWTAIGKQLEKLTDGTATKEQVKQLSPEAEGVWKTLADTFQKRSAMADKRVYNTVSKVTTSDVAKWIGNAVEANSQQVNAAGTSMPMHKLEQFSIHMNPSQSSQQQNENFTSQFARIIDTSRFMQNGLNGRPLTIALNPGNLGEILVKMQRVNGELMVKLLVHSPEAKQLLESNLGQLRHMFSPHQVAIERQDAQQATSAQNAQQNQQSFREDAREKEQRGNQQHENQQHEDAEEMSFSEFLMNAKV